MRGPLTLSSAPMTSRLFQPVQYGQKPEGRTVAFPSTHPPRTTTSTAASAVPQSHVRGRPPIATFSANPDAKGRPPVVISCCAPIRGFVGHSSVLFLLSPGFSPDARAALSELAVDMVTDVLGRRVLFHVGKGQSVENS